MTPDLPCSLASTVNAAHTAGVYVSEHGPICAACNAARSARGMEAPIRYARLRDTVDKSDRYVSVASHFRPPRATEDAHHTDPITVGGRIMYQQSPIVGGHDSSVTADGVRVAREISEGNAKRINDALELAPHLAATADRLEHIPRALVSAMLGISERALRRRTHAHAARKRAAK